MATVSDIVSLRIDTKCRICMFPKPNLSSLFRRGLSMKVMKLADIKMYEGDGLPSTICLDCELEVNRCVNFIGQIQRADMKLREMIDRESEFIEAYERDKELAERSKEMELGIQKVEDGDQEACTSQIDIEEFNVKQEITTLDNFLDEEADPKSESDHDHFEVALARNDEPEDEHELNPLNHVDVMEDENRSDAMDVPLDPLGQEEPLIESEKCDSNPSTDPLTFMKQEAVSMDIDKNSPEPSGSSSTVNATAIWPQNRNRSDSKTGQQQRFNLIHSGPNTKVACNTKFLPLLICTIPVTVRSTQSNPIRVDSLTSDQIPSASVQTQSTKPNKSTINQKPLNMFEEYKNSKTQLNTFCLVCNVECGSSDLLKEHEEKEGFMCRICTLEIKSHTDLEAHFFHHKSFKCNVCKKSFISKRDVAIHKTKDHPTVKFSCEICQKRYTRRKDLGMHKLEKHSNVVYSHKCVVCDKTFRANWQLQNHLTSVHVVKEFLNCKFCQSLCLGPDRLKHHVMTVHLRKNAIRCEVCDKVFSKTTISKHMLIHDNTESLCELCGISIKGKSAMISHMDRFHSEKGNFICRSCNKPFALKIELKRHYNKCKLKERPDPVSMFCEICGKKYKSWAILKQHKLIHSENRPFKCGECGATFKQDVTLRTHRRVHSNVGKYCCNGCGMTFKWKPTFDKHVIKCMVNDKEEQETISG